MRKAAQKYIMKKPLLLVAIIAFGIGIALYSTKEGFNYDESKKNPIITKVYLELLAAQKHLENAANSDFQNITDPLFTQNIKNDIIQDGVIINSSIKNIKQIIKKIYPQKPHINVTPCPAVTMVMAANEKAPATA
jgi:hypothetical protein